MRVHAVHACPAGEMLYLPAGWFYEATSCGKEEHMAFTYWFHPLDNLTRQGFSKPYTTGFWPAHFLHRFGGEHEKADEDTVRS